MKHKNKLIIGYIGNDKSTNRYHLPFIFTIKDKIEVKMIIKEISKIIFGQKFLNIYR